MSQQLGETQVLHTPLSCAGHFPHEGGWHIGVGGAYPSKQMEVLLK